MDPQLVNDRVEADRRARTREMMLAAAIGEVLTESGSLRELLQRSAESVVEHLDAAFARVWTLNEAEQVLELQASAGIYTHLDGPHGRVPVGKFKIGLIAQEQQPHLSNDVLNDPRVSDQEWARREGMVAFAGYPLMVEERTVGVFAMFSRDLLEESTLRALGVVANGIALSIDRDRAEQERAQLVRALERERAHLRSVFQEAPAFMATLRGPDHVFEIANAAYLQLVGHRDILGLSVREALPEVVEQGFLELLDHVYRSGEPFAGSEVPVVLQRISGGGTERRFVNLVYQPMYDVADSPIGILVHGVDVTEMVRSRERVEEQAAELEAQTHELQEQAVEMEMQSEELREQTALLQEQTAQLEETQAELQAGNADLWRANDTLRESDARHLALNEQLQEALAAARLAHEEAQAAQAEAQAANLAKSQFLANMSHEIRTPINAIMGYTDLLALGVEGTLSDGQQVYMSRVKAAGGHLIGLVNEVLDLAKIEAGELVVKREPTPLPGTLEGAVALVAPQAAAKELSISQDGTVDPGLIYHGDADRVRQILVNLLSNAVKFTDPGGRVEVRIRAGENINHSEASPGEGPWVVIEVQDSGIGIGPEQLERIFAPFVQIDDTNTRQAGGTGLGLTISREIARQMGGDLTVHSELDSGSCFALWLALTEVSISADPLPDTLPVAPVPVVVVAFGGDGDTLQELERAVHPAVRLLTTTLPDEVPLLAAREHARLVVLDSGEQTAWHVAQMVKDAPALAETAVLLLPSIPLPAEGGAAGGIDLGWVTLVPRPFTSEQINEAVREATWNAECAHTDGAACGCSVLIIDDDLDIRHIGTTYLEDMGANVRQAKDGLVALEEMRSARPDVVVLDLMMPIRDGFSVIAEMRADPELATIPVVALTARSLSDREQKFLAGTTVRVYQKGTYSMGDVASFVLGVAQERK